MDNPKTLTLPLEEVKTGQKFTTAETLCYRIKTPGHAYMRPSMISLNLFLFICFFGGDKVETEYRLTSD